MGADPVDSIVRWVRNQVYSNKLRWRDVHLEALSPVLAELANRSEDVALALKCSRAVYAQDAGTLRWASAEVARAGCQPGGGAGRAREVEIPQASSLMLRSAALSGYAVLDVTCEDVTRKARRWLTSCCATCGGWPTSWSAGRPWWSSACRASSGAGCSRGRWRSAPTTSRRCYRASSTRRWRTGGCFSTRPCSTACTSWRAPPSRRAPASLARAVKEKGARGACSEASGGGGGRAVPGCEGLPRRCGAGQPGPTDDFLQSTLRYFAGLNLRPEQPLIRQHEFDSVAAMVALCCDASLPGSVLCGAHEWMQQRLGEVKASLLDLLVANFHESSEVRVPIRAVVLGSWFQGTACQLLDLCRLLWLDHPEGHSPHMFLPEPRELYSGGLLAALYLGGAYDAWELQLPRSNSEWWWTGLLKQMSELRQEVIRAPVFGRWKKGLMDSMLPGMVRWPTHQQVQAEVQKCGAAGDELPIDEHRDKILKHIENYRVTCIQGETGCGKSTRVPVYVMEDYFEKKKAGKLKSEDTFMVLCTQPRRIACISLANRVASCMREKVGESIGYKISGDSNVRPGRTKMVYVTTGYLLQVLVNNPDQIRSYSHLILDEVHERDVDSDLLSLVVKLQMTGYNFKLVIMSATLQGDLFTRYFSDKKIKTIFVGVKRYPVEVVYVEQLLDRYGGRSYGHDLDGRQTSEATRGVQAPFASQAVRAVRDAERAFGSGGREAEGWEDQGARGQACEGRVRRQRLRQRQRGGRGRRGRGRGRGEGGAREEVEEGGSTVHPARPRRARLRAGASRRHSRRGDPGLHARDR
ncbi:unnamed protein product [Prorocentrum cordatum]|uniref:Helicase ATP-binding domain-containing protein n=1 Tax=Prorocentrum cordatum TaxID=2364126 RepID=A0ABN9XHG4_9DINO|nr:unnamed protein product [Polarella glacialis]